MLSRKKIALLGSTGSIGRNCLHIVDQMPDEFKVNVLTSHSNVDLLLEQARRYRPATVAVTGAEINSRMKDAFRSLDITLWTSSDALKRVAAQTEYDLFINAVVGAAGFFPTLQAIEQGANIALANKETLVVGGDIVMKSAAQKGVKILPIDSEHSALFQCLMGENFASIEEIFLTASGGPFRTWSKEKIAGATVEQALAHPNWNMGKKITIDSATMMNKGLEVIEAHWLFGVDFDRIRVVVHPESIIHSMVAFYDGSVKAQMGVPDMRVPIQLAMTYPERKPSQFPRIDFRTLTELHFENPDMEKFPALSLAYQAARIGGTAPAVMNAANEEAVRLFLQRQIRFIQIAEMIDQALNSHTVLSKPDVEDLLEADQWARRFVLQQKK